MLSAAVQEVLKVAVQEVQRRRHELLTVEHILFSLTTVAPGRLLLEGSGASVAVLREQLEGFFRNEMQVLPDQGEHEVHQTAGVQRVLERALGHIHASGRSQVELGDLFVAILDEEDSYAHYFLTRQGVDRLDALTFISHGMPEGGGSRGVSPDAAREKEEGEAGENVLEKYATELTARARDGKIDPLVGRQEELDRAIEVLCRRRKNNPLFVGDPGVGKTALAEGLALRIAQGQVPKKFKDVKIYALDMGLILAGTRYRGEFESRLKAIVEELKNIPDAVVFIDEIHTIVGAGATSGGSMDASNLLKPVLASGELRCIGSTTHEEFRNHLEKDRALTRRFQRIDVGEPNAEDCFAILSGLQSHYAGHHRVRPMARAPMWRASASISAACTGHARTTRTWPCSKLWRPGQAPCWGMPCTGSAWAGVSSGTGSPAVTGMGRICRPAASWNSAWGIPCCLAGTCTGTKLCWPGTSGRISSACRLRCWK